MSLDRLIPPPLGEADRFVDSDVERDRWERENCPYPGSLHRRREVAPPQDRMPPEPK